MDQPNILVAKKVESAVLDVPERLFARDKQIGRTVFLRISQFLTWPISFIFFHLIYDLRILGRENLHAMSSPFIIIANHVNISASFLFRLVLGFNTPHLPLRFMGVRQFNIPYLNFLSHIGVIDLVYCLFGVFTVVPGLGLAKNLEEAKSIIKLGSNVVIYPEGKIVSGDTMAPFKYGASVLAMDTHMSVLPISFRLGRRSFLRKKMTVAIGKPITFESGTGVEKVTDILYAKMEDLYGSMS
jgi:1-acyl-sn-glycerol-3-phosphate acyltransferase